MSSGSPVASELELESGFSCEDDELLLELLGEEEEVFLFFLLLLRSFLFFLFFDLPLLPWVVRGSSPSAALNSSLHTWSTVSSDPSLSHTRYCLVSSAEISGAVWNKIKDMGNHRF
jgi:hypothetical protein